MTVRRFSSLLAVALMSVSGGLLSTAAAAPKVAAPKVPAPPPPPADAGAPAPLADGSQPVEMTEDPPADMEGTSEDPDAPKIAGQQDETKAPPKAARSGYPIEEALRPITLLQNMSEVAIDPHLTVSPFQATMTLRARYGITRQVQLGLTYVLGAVYDDPKTVPEKTGIHAGRAVGLDVTVLLQDWIGVRVGVPVYIDPVATSLAIGAPMKFVIADKFAIGGLDDLLNIRLTKFAPTFNNEAQNASLAALNETKTISSKGDLRFSFYGIYNVKPNQAVYLRAAVTMPDFSANRTDAGGGLRTELRVGANLSPKKFLDLGLSLGFDDMARSGSFGPAGYLAFRI